MPDLTIEIRTHLRAALAALNALEKVCTPANGFGVEGVATSKAIEEIIDGFPGDIRGRCGDCVEIIFCGDKGHICHDGDPVFCAECAYTWADVKEQYDKGEHSGDDDERASFMKAFDAHIAAGGNATDKMLHDL